MVLISEKKPRWLTPSAINAYLRCPRKFFNKYILKLKGKPSIYLVRGNTVDKALEQFYKFKLNRRCASMDYEDLRKTVLDLLKDEWKRYESDLAELNLTPADQAFFYDEARKAMLNFLDWFTREKGFYKPDPWVQKWLFSKKFLIRGRADMIERFGEPPLIIDWKTNKSMELTSDIKRQLCMYALMYEQAFKVRPEVAAHFLNFQDGFKVFRLTDKAMDSVKAQIIDVHHRTQSTDPKDYPCKCGWCKTEFEKSRKEPDEE